MASVWFLTFCYIHCVAMVIGSSAIQNETLENTLNYINEKQKEQTLTQNSNIILVIGNTGSGKSTLIHYIAGDYSKIFSDEPSNPNSVNYVIRDELDPDRGQITFITKSRTLIPIVSTDENNNIFVDCPGFADTRNETVEITATFLIKRVIENASNIKIVLVVDSDGVTNSRADFDNLLARATDLMKNFEQFENSVSLVISKVPSFKMRGRKSVEIFENNVKNTTAQFMIDHKLVLQERKTNENKFRLIDALLEQSSSNDYPRISIFWRPNDVGPFDKLDKMIDGRRYIRESIIKHSSYAKVKLNDFGFPLTPQALSMVRDLVDYTISSISRTLQINVNKLIIEIQRQINSTRTFKRSIELITVGNDYINANSNPRKFTMNELSEQLMGLIRTYNITTIDTKELNQIHEKKENIQSLISLMGNDENSNYARMSQMLNNTDYNLYLEQVKKLFADLNAEIMNKLIRKASDSTQMISSILKRVDTELFDSLQNKVKSTSGFQNRLDLLQLGHNSIRLVKDKITLNQRIEQLRNLTYAYDVASVNVGELSKIDRLVRVVNELKLVSPHTVQFPVYDWIDLSSHSINYQRSMYDWYLFLVESYEHLSDYDTQKNIAQKPVVDKNNFNSFIKRIKRSAEYEPTIGNILEINEIINMTMSSPNYECDNETLVVRGTFVKSSDIESALKVKCPTADDLKEIEVYVLDTFYIDCDLYLNKTNKLSLQVLAPKWNVRKGATFYLNGVNGKTELEPAKEGLPGDEGGDGTDAGSFFGWANEIINGDWLKIELNGGNGGDGQDGGSSPDVNVYFPKDEFSESGSIDGAVTPDDYYRRFFRQHGYNADLWESSYYVTYFHVVNVGTKIKQTFRLYPDHCCGSTGVGGFGGEGGNGGVFVFSYQGNSTNIPKNSSANGKTGKAGMNGKSCRTYALELKIDTDLNEYVTAFRYDFISKFYDKTPIVYSKCPSTPTYTLPSRRYRPMRIKLNFSEQAVNFFRSIWIGQVIPSYESYLLESMIDPVYHTIAQKAYETIDFNSGTLNFAQEAIILERQFFELNKHFNVLPLYENLLKRVEAYETAHKFQLSSIDQQRLQFIHVTLFSKITSIRSGHDSDLIVNIAKFLELILENVEELKMLDSINAIKNQRDECIDGIDAKIKEAKAFIEQDIILDIEHTFSLLSIELKKVVDETLTLQVINNHNIDMNEENLRTIKQNVFTRQMLSFVQMTIGVVGDISSNFFGKFTARTINGGIEAIKSSIIDPKAIKNEIPLGIQSIRRKMYKNDRDKVELLENELNELRHSISNFNITNRELLENLNDLQSKVNQVNMTTPDVHYKVSYLLKESMDFLVKWKTIFAVSSDENKVPILLTIQKAHNVLLVVSVSIATYQDIGNNNEHINEVAQAINDGRETLQALMIFEDEIYSVLMPTVNALHDHLIDITQNAANRSSAGLDILQWKIGRTLRNVQRMLSEKLAQLEAEDSVHECMIRINEAINICIDIFDRIQTYEQDSKLVTFLSVIKIDELEDAFSFDFASELQLNIKSNLLLGQYYRIMNAFKQVIFPYAADYSSEYELRTSLQSKNTTMMVPFISKQIKLLSKKLREYNDSSISDNDHYIHSGNFNREDGSTGPFFVWRNSEVHDKIEQLFSGKKVYLFADILKSDTRNAIKFRDIELKFHSDNQTVNNQIQEILQSFHISMTHMGTSNYRCNNTFYTMSSRPLTLKYSIARRNGERSDENWVYSKLRTGVSLLSPYTMWSMQLFYGEFEKLKPFVDFVNVELHGAGLYVEENARICDTDLGKYYQLMKRL